MRENIRFNPKITSWTCNELVSGLVPVQNLSKLRFS